MRRILWGARNGNLISPPVSDQRRPSVRNRGPGRFIDISSHPRIEQEASRASEGAVRDCHSTGQGVPANDPLSTGPYAWPTPSGPEPEASIYLPHLPLPSHVPFQDRRYQAIRDWDVIQINPGFFSNQRHLHRSGKGGVAHKISVGLQDRISCSQARPAQGSPPRLGLIVPNELHAGHRAAENFAPSLLVIPRLAAREAPLLYDC
jgi:hypothetical protein